MAWYDIEVGDILTKVADVAFVWSGQLWQYAYTNRTHWIAKHFIPPIVDPLSDFLSDLGNGLDSFTNKYNNLAQFAADMWAGSLLDNLIKGIWEGWFDFTGDPKGYILDRVFPIGTDLYWFSVDPVAYVDLWIDEKWPNLKHIAYDPAQYVIDRIFVYGTPWHWFLENPGKQIEAWIGDWNPALADFLFDMDGWLAERVGDPGEAIREWITSRMLHILQTVIENTWEGGEAD